MNLSPSLKTTIVSADLREWTPCCFDSFVQELSYTVAQCEAVQHRVLFRGHRDSRWLLDSTFVRRVKEEVLGISSMSRISKEYRASKNYLNLLSSLFFFKFGVGVRPSQQLFGVCAKDEELDPWFELMKRIQQYPEEDCGTLRGTFLLDWTQNRDVAMFFANELRCSHASGAVWIADITAMGAILHQDMKVIEIMKIMEESIAVDKASGCPLVFCPKKQTACARARNQDAIYMAQMDLRYDLADIWSRMPANGESVFLKIILPAGTVHECEAWLAERGITETFIYPDKKSSTTTDLS